MGVSHIRKRCAVVIGLRSEVEGDEGTIDALIEAAFGGNREEPELVVALRRDASRVLSRVAVVHGEVAGYVIASPETIRGGQAAPPVAGVGPLGVLPKCQRRGVGSALMYEIFESSAALGWQALFLLGNPAYYSRFGFESSAPHGIRSKYPDEHFQLKELVAGSLDGVKGEFVYHEAFEAGGR